MSYMTKHVKRYRNPFILAVICLGAEAFCDLLQPTLMSRLVDQGVAAGKLHLVLIFGLRMLAVAAIGACFATSRNVIASTVSQRLGRDLRGELFRKVQSLSKTDIDSFETATLITRLTNDVTQVQNFANGIMRILVKAPLLAIGSIVMATILNPRLALIVYAVTVAVLLLSYWSLRVGYPLFARIQQGLDRLNSVMREYLAGVRVVKAFNNYDYEEHKFVAANDSLTDTSIRAARVMAIFSPATSLCINGGIVLILWLGGVLTSRGQMHVGQVMAFVNYMTQLLMSLGVITMAFTMFVREKASAVRIGEVMEVADAIVAAPQTPAPAHPSAPTTIPDGPADVEFCDVSFAFGGSSEPVLSHVSFSCRAGESVGIIGSTGCGKTTLTNLLMRFYEPTGGCIRVGGVEIANCATADLRSMLAIVPQKSLLFTGTILDNIRWGRGVASADEVRAAAAAAQADTFISGFPNGYDSMLGQGGVNLSGGQKQRVSVARALIKRPRVLILDDATSSVDMTTEARMRRSISEFSQGMGCLIIAQRLTSVMGLDRILVLDAGCVAGFGTHEELMYGCDVYRDVYRSQIGGDEHGRPA